MENFLSDILLLKYLKIEPFSYDWANKDLKNALGQNFEMGELPQHLTAELITKQEDFSKLVEKMRNFLYRYDHSRLLRDSEDIHSFEQIETVLALYMPDRKPDIHKDLVIAKFYTHKLDQDREKRHLVAKAIGEIYAKSPITEKEAPAEPIMPLAVVDQPLL